MRFSTSVQSVRLNLYIYNIRIKLIAKGIHNRSHMIHPQITTHNSETASSFRSSQTGCRSSSSCKSSVSLHWGFCALLTSCCESALSGSVRLCQKYICPTDPTCLHPWRNWILRFQLFGLFGLSHSTSLAVSDVNKTRCSAFVGCRDATVAWKALWPSRVDQNKLKAETKLKQSWNPPHHDTIDT